ncbi:MAG: LysM peptidoglycan-binding domain-containing protein [Deltaproteobacteria bacterium]|nr:LysM peptidoglycan-binding domain-containing protein [Deltaproteobacteria bacterium]
MARFIAGAFAAFAVASAGIASALTPLDPAKFPTPPQLEPNVLFWTDVYSRHTSHQVVIHDNLYLDIVYTVLDFSDLDAQDVSSVYKASVRDDSVRKAIHDYEDILRDLAQSTGPRAANPSEHRDVEAMFKRVPGGDSKYLSAIGRIRAQTGLKDKFEVAVGRSGRYMPTLERIFRTRGLPVELSRLPFVESMFQDRARSKVGAGGIWQFMPSTGRRYLRIRRELDERWDPFAATDGAARLLSDNYESLGTWPLALTAYNHGAAGMARAVSQVGTRDLGVIVWNYESSSFGFASRNFYSEFLAAVSVYENRAIYFPNTRPEPPLTFDEVLIAKPTSIRSLAERTGTDVDALEDLNLGLTSEVIAGRYPLPAGYRLRVPPGSEGQFRTALDSMPAIRTATAASGARSHRVARGDTASSIAARYKITTAELLSANGLKPSSRIRSGQTLRIPGNGAEPNRLEDTPSAIATLTVTPAREPANDEVAPPRLVAKSEKSGAPARPRTHVVGSGESLSAIASRYGTTVRALQDANGMTNPALVKPGQTLRLASAGEGATKAVPPPAGAPTSSSVPSERRDSNEKSGKDATKSRKPMTHKVKRGETLIEIAARYGTSVTDLKKENRLRGQVIQPDQLLRIPLD